MGTKPEPSENPKRVTARKFRAFQNAPTPVGYDTAFSYFSKRHPIAFDYLYDPVLDVETDLGRLTILTIDAGTEVKIVEAPDALRERGIKRTLAFPVDVLLQFYR